MRVSMTNCIENTSSCLENVKTTLNMKFKSSQKMTLKKEWREYFINIVRQCR